MTLIIDLLNNQLVTALATLISVFAFILALSQIRFLKPCFYIESISIIPESIQKELSKLEIFYDKKSIDKLTSSKIVFINQGNIVLENEDIAPRHPLIIHLNPESMILSHQVIYAPNKEVNGFDVPPNSDSKNKLEITFDYLAQSEGGIIFILHTGDSNDLRIDGTVKGTEITKLHKNSKLYKIDYISLFIITYAMVSLINYLNNIFSSEIESKSFLLELLFSLTGNLFILIILVLVIFIYNKLLSLKYVEAFFTDRIPKEYLNELKKD